MLVPGAFLEFLGQELPRGKLEGKGRRERRAQKVCWQVQLGLGCLTLQCPVSPKAGGWVPNSLGSPGSPPVGNLWLWELQKTLGIVSVIRNFHVSQA